MSTTIPRAPQGNAPVLGIPDSQDIPRLVLTYPYYEPVPLAEIIAPTVTEAVEAQLPTLVPPYVQAAADAAVQQLSVLLTGSSMSGALYLSPLMPTQPNQAATMAYVDSMVATAGVPEVPSVPVGQVWARTTGQWVPISEQEGTFLPLAGGVMQGQIQMSGYAINGLAALPNMPNGAAPASWVLQQIAAVSLYQGTWNVDTYTPDLTQPQYQVNGYTWIAITTSTSGVVIGPAIPGLQGQTVFNGDTIIWSNIQGLYNRIHSGGLSLAEAQALFLPFTGGTLTGPLLAYENPTATMEVATMGWVESLIPTGGIIPEAPTDGQLYGRNGLTHSWLPVLPLAGGIMTGAIQLSGNAVNALSPVPLQQMTSTLSAQYLALAGGTMQGLIVLSGNASANLNPVPLQQLNAMLGGYVTSNQLTTSLAGYLPLIGGTLTGALNGTALTLSGNLDVNGTTLLSGTTTVGNLNASAAITANGVIQGNGPAGVTATVFQSLTGTAAPLRDNGGHVITFGFSQTTGGVYPILNYSVNGGTMTPLVTGNNFQMPDFVGGTAGPTGVTLNAYDNSNNLYGIFVDGISDERVKHNIAPTDVDALAVLAAMPVEQFDIDEAAARWLKGAGLSDADRAEMDLGDLHVPIGFVAQHIQPYTPQAVSQLHHPNPPEGYPLPADMFNIIPQNVVPYLVRGVQQLAARVAALEARA